MRLPANNQWVQINKGDRFGFLKETENVSLLVDGKLKLSRKSFNRYNSDDNVNLSHVLGIVYYSGRYLALTRESAFLFDLGGSTVTEVTLSTDIDINSDIITAYNRAYITTNDNLDYYDGSLNASNYALTAGVPHPMTVFDSLTTYKLVVGNGNTVVPLSSSHVAGTILTLPPEYQVTSLAYRNSFLYVATKHINGGEARIFVWDGNGTNANYDIPVGASQIYSIKPYKSTVAFVTNKGFVGAASGTSYIELATFPIYEHKHAIWDNTAYLYAPSKILNRGMVTVNDSIYFHIDGTVDSGNIPEMKHGVWVFEPNKGLYHTSYSSVDRSVVEAPTDLSDNTLTTSAHNLKDGDLLVVRSAGSLVGVATDTTYFVKVISDNQIKLATSRLGLKNGKYVTISGAVTGSNISYVPNTDYGQYTNSFAGAIAAINPEEPFFKGWESPIIWGNRFEDKDGNEFYALCSFTMAWNIGRMTTQRIYSSKIEDVWQKLYTYFTGLTLDNEQIVVKYKTNTSRNCENAVISGYWLSPTQFVVNSTTSPEAQNIEEGEEVTILDGYGRGYTAHIVELENLGNNLTVTIDESIGAANKPLLFSVDSFVKVSTIDNQNVHNTGIFRVNLDTTGSYIQLKLEIRGFETEIDMFELLNIVHESGN